jgi:5-oxoprolinase (ATP-hydrolysing)
MQTLSAQLGNKGIKYGDEKHGSTQRHADIGGLTPGSMPPNSQHINDEGVLLTNVKLVEQGVLQEAQMLHLLTTAPYPARNPAQNIADLKAQIAANQKGWDELTTMVKQFGLEPVLAYMQFVQDNAEQAVREAIVRLKDGAFTLPLVMRSTSTMKPFRVAAALDLRLMALQSFKPL